jgi:tetrahydromethanopterin S-methyltransferase subunit A
MMEITFPRRLNYMPIKKAPAEKWPVLSGEYVTGDPESAVAVVTLGSHMDDIPVKAGAAISGPLHTENLGIEKVIANTISNPNIRFLVVCGSEVQGHITGQSIKAVHENGVDADMRIVGSQGAIPILDNMTGEGVQRFRDQLEIVDLVDVEDHGTIQSKIEGCLVNDAGAYEEETGIIPLLKKQKDSNLATENSQAVECVEEG